MPKIVLLDAYEPKRMYNEEFRDLIEQSVQLSDPVVYFGSDPFNCYMTYRLHYLFNVPLEKRLVWQWRKFRVATMHLENLFNKNGGDFDRYLMQAYRINNAAPETLGMVLSDVSHQRNDLFLRFTEKMEGR